MFRELSPKNNHKESEEFREAQKNGKGEKSSKTQGKAYKNKNALIKSTSSIAMNFTCKGLFLHDLVPE